MALTRLRIIFINVAQRLQNITARFREVRGHVYKLPATMSQTVSEQDLRAVAQFGRITRQRITHLQGPGKIRGAMLEQIGKFSAAVLAAVEVESDPASLLFEHIAEVNTPVRS